MVVVVVVVVVVERAICTWYQKINKMMVVVMVMVVLVIVVVVTVVVMVMVVKKAALHGSKLSPASWSAQFSSVPFKMVSMRSGKPMCAPTPSLRSFSNVAFETVPMLV